MVLVVSASSTKCMHEEEKVEFANLSHVIIITQDDFTLIK